MVEFVNKEQFFKEYKIQVVAAKTLKNVIDHCSYSVRKCSIKDLPIDRMYPPKFKNDRNDPVGYDKGNAIPISFKDFISDEEYIKNHDEANPNQLIKYTSLIGIDLTLFLFRCSGCERSIVLDGNHRLFHALRDKDKDYVFSVYEALADCGPLKERGVDLLDMDKVCECGVDC